MPHHNSSSSQGRHGYSTGNISDKPQQRPRTQRNRSTETSHSSFNSTSFRPFVLFPAPDNHQDDDDATAGGDNKLSRVYSAPQARWRGFRMRRPRIVHSPDGDRAASITPLRVIWDRHRGANVSHASSIWQQWRHVLASLESGTPIRLHRPAFASSHPTLRRLKRSSINGAGRLLGYSLTLAAVILMQRARRRNRSSSGDRNPPLIFDMAIVLTRHVTTVLTGHNRQFQTLKFYFYRLWLILPREKLSGHMMIISLDRITAYFTVLTGFFVSFTHSQFCGRAPPIAQARIVGGQRAFFGQIPWQVSLQAFGTHYCGGAILNDRWIITAAHCALAVGRNQLQLVVGALDITKFDAFLQMIPEQRFNADLIITHENFNRRQLLFDIALIRLDRRINFNGQAQPVCLPQQDEDFLGMMGLVSGWGKQSENDIGSSATMNFVQMPIMSNRDCQMMFSNRDPPQRVVIRNEWICAGFREGGRDACQGDSGGPMTVFQNGVWELGGIVSGGFGCARANSPGIFTRVASFVTWINQKIAANP